MNSPDAAFLLPTTEPTPIKPHNSMTPFSHISIAIALVFAVLMSVRGIKRKSLTKAGAVCAFVVGFLSLACGLRGFLLLLFYVVSLCGMLGLLAERAVCIVSDTECLIILTRLEQRLRNTRCNKSLLWTMQLSTLHAEVLIKYWHAVSSVLSFNWFMLFTVEKKSI